MFRLCHKNIKLNISESFRVFFKIMEIIKNKEGIKLSLQLKARKARKSKAKQTMMKRE